MGLVIEESKGSGSEQMELPKKGPRPAALVGIIDIGVQEREYKGEKQKPCREIIPLFSLLADKYTDDDGVEHNMPTRMWPIKVLAGCTRGNYFDFLAALDPHSNMMKNGAGNLHDLLGAKCFANMIHSDPNSEGLVYANCKSLQEIVEGYPVEDYKGEFTVFDTGNPSKETFDGFSDWIKDKIRGSLDYAGSDLEKVCEGLDGVSKPVQGEDGSFDDDIPF